MTNLRRLRGGLAAGLLGLLASAGPAAAAVIFSDNFDDADVSDWTKTTNYGGSTTMGVASSTVSAPHSLLTAMSAPPGGVDLFVRASHNFTSVVSGPHVLDLYAFSSPCSGCTISYDVLIDGVLLQRGQSYPALTPHSYNVSLSAGSHTLTLGMHTTNASSGGFYATFDNVTISDSRSIPEPGTLALLGLGLAGFAATRRRKL